MEKEIYKKKILNPFALPPETDARFRLLLVAVIVISLILGNYLPVYFLPDDLTDTLISPEVDFRGNSLDKDLDLKDSGLKMIYDSLEYVPSILIMIFILAITFFCSMIIYRKYPRKIIAKQKLIRVNPDKPGKYLRLNEEITKLSKQCGIETPEIYIASGFTAGAQAFGVSKKRSVRIDNGLRLLFFKNYEKFKSIILHELGHLVNRDVSKTYMSLSLWKSVLFIFAIPTIILVIVNFLLKVVKKLPGGMETDDVKGLLFQSLPYVIILLLSLTTFFFMIYLLLKSILRTREYYADWRAANTGVKESLISYFKENFKKEKSSLKRKKFFSWHPSIKERIDCLNDPSVLFKLNNDLSFVVGLFIPFSIFSVLILGKIGITISGIFSGTGQLISQDLGLNVLSVLGGMFLLIIICFVPFIVTSYLISSSLGLQIQRNMIYNLSSGNENTFGMNKTFLTAVIITIGMTAGSLILPYFSILNIFVDYGIKEILLEKVPLIILTILLALLLNFFWVFYVKFYTVNLFGRYTGSVKPKLRYRSFNLISSLLLSIMILPVAGIYFSIYTTKIEPLNDFIIILLIAVPVIYLMVFILTGIFFRILNSKDLFCSKCGNPLPKGNLIGKNCTHCDSAACEWLYV